MATTADQVKVLEMILGKTKNAAMVDTTKVQANTGMTREKLDELVADKRYQESPSFRKEVDSKFQQFYG
jgi:mannose/fructose-specific phosphotransferase system component IIA